MAQYKVLQDIEADDKLLGPLSLRQFIYAVIVVVLGFTAFKLATIQWLLVIPFILPMIFFGLLAAPFGRDQPSEVWLLAKIKFFLKNRKRIWDQSGVKELVTITVPKTIERVYTKGFSEQEVSSRLKALASTLDTRGWAVKNIDVATFRQPIIATNQSSDRLVDISNIPQDIDTANDILDEINNPVAQHVGEMIDASSTAHRQELIDKVRKIADHQRIIEAGPDPSLLPKVVIEQMKQQEEQAKLAQGNMRRLEPLAPQVLSPSPVPVQAATQPAVAQDQTLSIQQTQTAVTPPTDPGILKLVKNNDLNVATIGREASRKKVRDLPEDEVVIPLR